MPLIHSKPFPEVPTHVEVMRNIAVLVLDHADVLDFREALEQLERQDSAPLRLIEDDLYLGGVRDGTIVVRQSGIVAVARVRCNAEHGLSSGTPSHLGLTAGRDPALSCAEDHATPIAHSICPEIHDALGTPQA